MKDLTQDVNAILEMGLTALLQSKNDVIAITKVEERLFLNGLIADESLNQIVTALQSKGYSKLTWE